MPAFSLTAHSDAPVEDVWKLLHDPSRFPEWWAGVERVQAGDDGAYTIWPDGYPDFPMAQQLRSERADGRVTISCLVSDLQFRWTLSDAGDGTDVRVEVELPEREAHRLETQRTLITRSLTRLTTLATT
jgi:uncharacterized protein YndB with AHSA1/START domain